MARHADDPNGPGIAPGEERSEGSDEEDALAPEVRHPAQVIVRVALAVVIAALLILTVWALVARST